MASPNDPIFLHLRTVALSHIPSDRGSLAAASWTPLKWIGQSNGHDWGYGQAYIEGMLAKSTLVYLLNSIVYPSHPKFTVGILLKGQVFVIYAELAKLQNCPEERGIHRLGQTVSQHYCSWYPSTNCMFFGLLFEQHHFYGGTPLLAVRNCVLCN